MKKKENPLETHRQRMLETYRRGDFHERLNLFCQHRSFRTEFIAIENNDCILPENNPNLLVRPFAEKPKHLLKNAVGLILSKLYPPPCNGKRAQ